MKKIPLNLGKFALVDDEDFEELNKYKWHICAKRYARRRDKNKYTLMHRFLMKTPTDKECDHINGNGFDNRKRNLRNCTHAENIRNQKISSANSSGYRGVQKSCKEYRKWAAYIKTKGKKIFLGYFKSKIKAAKVYDKKAKELFSSFARLNFPKLK